MDKQQKSKLINNILQTCLFSEYLPPEFNTTGLTDLCFTEPLPIDSNAPITFSMDKYNDYGNRRFISIPSIVTFIDAVLSLSDGTILANLIDQNKKDSHTLSKIVNTKYEIKQFSEGYNFSIDTSQTITKIETPKDFQTNLNTKIERSKGCTCILHLDISNFFASIYTHNITTLLDGEVWANGQYHAANPTHKYKVLKNLDIKIAAMNQKRTHGLLVGPRISFLIAESLLTRIDYELAEQLEAKSIDFVRYVDDYDVFIKNENQIEIVKNIFNQTLQRYGLLLNDSKTKIEHFPFYAYADFNSYDAEDLDLVDLYAKFAGIEKSGLQNGALLYFCQNILSRYTTSYLALSLSFSILKNMPKAVMSCCKNIANIEINSANNLEIESMLDEMLYEVVEQKKDLESIWILYTLLKMFPDHEIKLEKLNEICLVVYLYESNIKDFDQLKIHAQKSQWLLNYELFFNDIISKDEFAQNVRMANVDYYSWLKDNGINFYSKV